MAVFKRKLSSPGGCLACRAVCHRLQPALVAAGYAPSGPKGHFLRPALLLLIVLISSDHARSNSFTQNFRLAGTLR